MRLTSHDADLIRSHYLAVGIPVDQFAKRPQSVADAFLAGWNALSGRNDSWEDVRHYMMSQRKQKLWVVFNGQHRRMQELPDDTLSEEQWDILRELYLGLMGPDQLGSDNLAHDPNLGRTLANAFASATGRYEPPARLYALIMARRKAGEWLRVGRRNGPDRGIGFSDIDEIAQ